MNLYVDRSIHNSEEFGEFEDRTESEDSSEEMYSDGGEGESTSENRFSNPTYSRDIGGVPLLSPEQEGDLAKRISEGKRRINSLLLQSPVGLAWIAQTANQMKRGEIRPKHVIEVFPGRNKESDSKLKKRFISCAKEILEVCVEDYCLQEKIGGPREEDYSRKTVFAHNQIAIETLVDRIRLKTDILGRLEKDLGRLANSLVGHGRTSWSVSFGKRLESILSAVEKSRQEVKEAKDYFVKANLRLVIRIANKYVNMGISLADLIQEGNIGLMKAVERFDYRKRYRFSTYASWWIMQGITRAIAEQARTIRVPVHILENETKILRTFYVLSNQLGRKPAPSEVAEATNMPIKKVNKVFEIPLGQPISLDTSLEDRGAQFGDFIADEDAVSPLEMTIRNDLTMEIRNLLSILTPREAKILRMRFGIDEKREYTLEELGGEFGITRERIRQIEVTALQKLKHSKRKSRLVSFCE